MGLLVLLVAIIATGFDSWGGSNRATANEKGKKKGRREEVKEGEKGAAEPTPRAKDEDDEDEDDDDEDDAEEALARTREQVKMLDDLY
ncbi:MAG: hypothetical protein KDA36_12980, partial [Planctomycetaceae bacterium]|nr:hypothetical protein [Planctomycetaceae bacterium]